MFLGFQNTINRHSSELIKVVINLGVTYTIFHWLKLVKSYNGSNISTYINNTSFIQKDPLTIAIV